MLVRAITHNSLGGHDSVACFDKPFSGPLSELVGNTFSWYASHGGASVQTGSYGACRIAYYHLRVSITALIRLGTSVDDDD